MRLPAKERTTSKCAAAHVSSDRSFVDVMCPMWVAAVVCSHAVDVHDVRARYVLARQMFVMRGSARIPLAHVTAVAA